VAPTRPATTVDAVADGSSRCCLRRGAGASRGWSDIAGSVTLRHHSRLHHIGVRRRHAGVQVLLLAHELDVGILTEDGEILRHLTLDPTRSTL
jgi:hypothetical protein